MKRFLGLIALGAIGLAALPASQAQAQVFNVATFEQLSDQDRPFTFVNNNLNPGTLTGTATNVPVAFRFVGGNPFLTNAALATQNSGTGIGKVSNVDMNLSVTATAPATVFPPDPAPFQILTQSTLSGFMEFRYTGANTNIAGTAFNTNDLLLRVDFTISSIYGQRNGTSATMDGSDVAGDMTIVTFSSDPSNKFFDFSGIKDEAFSVAFSNLSASLQRAAVNNLLSSFNASGSGRFSAGFVPEPGSIAMVGLGLLGLPGLAVLRRRRAAR